MHKYCFPCGIVQAEYWEDCIAERVNCFRMIELEAINILMAKIPFFACKYLNFYGQKLIFPGRKKYYFCAQKLGNLKFKKNMTHFLPFSRFLTYNFTCKIRKSDAANIECLWRKISIIIIRLMLCLPGFGRGFFYGYI